MQASFSTMLCVGYIHRDAASVRLFVIELHVLNFFFDL